MVTTPLVSADDYLDRLDLKKYSLSRLLNNLFLAHPNNQSWCLETEVSDDLKLKYEDKTGRTLIPASALGFKSIATDNTGENLVGKSTSEKFNFYPAPQSQVLKLGGQLVTGLKNNFEILGTDSPFNAYFVRQRDTIPPTNPNTRKIIMKPYKLGVLCDLTLEMLRTAPLFADRYIAEGFQRALARKIDQTVFIGSGIDQPLGLASHPDLNSIVLGMDGDYPHLAAIVEMERLVKSNNPIKEESLAYFLNSETAAYLKKTEKVSGSGEFLMADQPLFPLDELKILNSRRAVVTNNLPSDLTKGTSNDLSMMLFGDWSQVVIGLFGEIALDLDPFSKKNFDEGLVTVRLLANVDIAILNPQLFCVATDLKTVM